MAEEETEDGVGGECLMPLPTSHGAGVNLPAAAPVDVAVSEAAAAAAAAVTVEAAAVGDMDASTERWAVDGDTCATRSGMIESGDTTNGVAIDNWTRRTKHPQRSM